MSFIIKDLDLVIAYQEKTIQHLADYSSRQDLVATGKQVLTKLRQMREDILANEALIGSQADHESGRCPRVATTAP
ncbi:MAG: hypothetical protein U5L96_11980 [Owenweeksia sp.]|nr:hypothetical protein [Owenweeksia sp.]